MYNGTHCFRIVLRHGEWIDFDDHQTRSAAQGGRIAEILTEEMGDAVKPISIQSKEVGIEKEIINLVHSV